MNKTNFTSLFPTFDRTAVASHHALRQAARARLAQASWPTAKFEDWRFTSVGPLVDSVFELPASDWTIDLALLPKRQGTETIRLVFINGRFSGALSSVPATKARIATLADAKNATLLTKIANDDDSPFTALNTSFLDDGACLQIPDGVVLEQPIEIIQLARGGRQAGLLNPRVLIVLGKNAQATIVERFRGEGGYFTNAVTEIALGEHALLDHVKVQQESNSAAHIATTQVVQAARSTFATHYLSLGGDLVRNEIRVRFDGERAEATVNGLYMGTGKQHLDNFTVIDHAQPNCASHELYKGILDGRAHGVFNGKIFVRKDAQKTDAKQTNKVLLLSDDATINTKPQLEIFADDVKCTHGATVGQLDANQLFYLQSRGIPLEQARRLLTFAFANDIVSRIKIDAIRSELEARIVK